MMLSPVGELLSVSALEVLCETIGAPEFVVNTLQFYVILKNLNALALFGLFSVLTFVDIHTTIRPKK